MKTQARSLTVSALIAAVLLPSQNAVAQTFAFWHGTSAGILPSDTKGKGKKNFRGRFSDHAATAQAEAQPNPEAPPQRPASLKQTQRETSGSSPDPFDYKLTLACGQNRVRGVDGSDDVTNCSYALKACQYRTPPSNEPLYYIWQRKKTPANSPWQIVGDTCGTQSAPAAAPPPPPVPTLAQIQQAFKRLPFSKPTVRIEPRGNVTLVNLPTYYEATWPDDTGLQPGEISQPVQLLSWSVEFKISSRSYTFHYGDGTSSGKVEDAGGGYPDGVIKHTYGKPIGAAKVTVDSQLTGQFRVNGGTWIDIDTIADLQDEPVTTLAVKESKARLYSNDG